MKMFSLILMIVAGASADVVLNGACPSIQPVKNFDLSAYAGTWYAIKNIPVENELHGKCESAVYELSGDSLKLKYSQVNDGLQEYVNGVAYKAHDANNGGKLVLNIEIEKSILVQPITIVDTDYINYSISYNCKYDENSNTHKLNVWVLSRSKGLNCKSKAAVDYFINTNFGNVDPSKFVVVEVSDEACRYHTSRVYSGPTRH